MTNAQVSLKYLGAFISFEEVVPVGIWFLKCKFVPQISVFILPSSLVGIKISNFISFLAYHFIAKLLSPH